MKCNDSLILMSVYIELNHKTTVHILSAYVPQSGCTDIELEDF